MKVKLNEKLKTYDGKVLKDGVDDQVRDMTVKDVCLQALTAVQEEDRGKAVKIYELGVRVAGNEDEINLKSEEVTILKDTIGEVYRSPVVIGQMCKLLEGD